MPLWYPVVDHPNAGGPAWYSLDARGLVCRVAGHPGGPSTVPTFRITDAVAYSTGFDTAGGAGIPWFTIVGSMVYPASGHPLGESRAPFYQMRGEAVSASRFRARPGAR